MTVYHTSLITAGALKRPNGTYITFRHSDGRPMTNEELRHHLQGELDLGHEVLPLYPCSNWDWKTGCKGHPEEIWDPERQPASGGGPGAVTRTPASPLEPAGGPEPATDRSPVLLTFPGDGPLGVWLFRTSFRDELQRAFPGLDIMAEVRCARSWILSSGGLPRNGMQTRLFLTGWCQRIRSNCQRGKRDA